MPALSYPDTQTGFRVWVLNLNTDWQRLALPYQATGRGWKAWLSDVPIRPSPAPSLHGLGWRLGPEMRDLDRLGRHVSAPSTKNSDSCGRTGMHAHMRVSPTDVLVGLCEALLADEAVQRAPGYSEALQLVPVAAQDLGQHPRPAHQGHYVPGALRTD